MRPLITLKRQGLSFFVLKKYSYHFFLCFSHSTLLKAKKKPLARPGIEWAGDTDAVGGRERAVDTDAVGGRWSVVERPGLWSSFGA